VAIAIVQHHGRPYTPTDQAQIETLFGHVKGEWPHLEGVNDAERERVCPEYNTVRLHAAIAYVALDDEHNGRGEAIREARRRGLQQAREERFAYYGREHRYTEEERP
jgi:transposase InsO family protein